MVSVYDKYDTVVGLEVHIQLLTKSKAYSSDKNEYGALPNTHVSTLNLGHPGTLPKVNKKPIEYAIRLGLATHCDIADNMYFSRKNYFYADHPKGYQITQDKTPICNGGYIKIKNREGIEKTVNLTRIHMEKDVGKSIHDIDPFNTLIDLNRAGVPLLEIVSEPELFNATEAYNYLAEVRKLVRYLEICDGNLEEGSLRCDTNISKCGKESAHDYRYFAEPDLQPVLVKKETIAEVNNALAPLPAEFYKRFATEFGHSEYDVTNLTENKHIALFYTKLADKTKKHKASANQVMGPVKSYLNTHRIQIQEYPLSINTLADIISPVDEGKISSSAVSQKLFPLLYEKPKDAVEKIAIENNFLHNSDKNEIESIAREIIENWPNEVKDYKYGNKNLLGLYMGELMKASKGKANPKVANQLIKKLLEE